MDFEQSIETLLTYGGRHELRIEIPIETEILIPDYQPEVFKIVKCLIDPILLNNSIVETKWNGTGYLRCAVYYQSEENGVNIYRVTQKFQFEKTGVLPDGDYTQGPAIIHGETEYDNCRAVSGHRIEVRGAYILRVMGEPTERAEVMSKISGGGVEQRTVCFDDMEPVGGADTVITSEMEIEMPGVGEKIINVDGYFIAETVGLVEKGLQCAGMLKMQVCYTLPGETMGNVPTNLNCKKAETKIRQTVHLPGMEENDNRYFWGKIMDCVLHAGEGGEKAILSVTWMLHCEVWRIRNCFAVADAYSTMCETQTIQTQVAVLKKVDDISYTGTVTLTDRSTEEQVTLYQCVVQQISVETKEKAQKTQLLCRGVAHVFYVDERGEALCRDRGFEWPLPQEYEGPAEDYCLHAEAYISNSRSRQTDEGVMIELEVTVQGILLRRELIRTVAELIPGEVLPSPREGPSLYLYFANGEEKLFDIAKHYHAHVEDLIAVNHLEIEETNGMQQVIPEDTCLLIPSMP